MKKSWINSGIRIIRVISVIRGIRVIRIIRVISVIRGIRVIRIML